MVGNINVFLVKDFNFILESARSCSKDNLATLVAVEHDKYGTQENFYAWL